MQNRDQASDRIGARGDSVSSDLLRQGRLCRAEDFRNCCGIGIPRSGLLLKLPTSLARQPIELCFPIIFRESPFRLEKAFGLEAPKCGIECALLQGEGFIAVAPDQAGDRISMERTPD